MVLCGETGRTWVFGVDWYVGGFVGHFYVDTFFGMLMVREGEGSRHLKGYIYMSGLVWCTRGSLMHWVCGVSLLLVVHVGSFDESICDVRITNFC